MAAKKTKNTKTKKQLDDQKQVVDTYARILQLVAIVAVIAIYVISAISPSVDIPVWVPAGLLGVAIGLSPEQMGKIIGDIIKSFVGKK